MRAIATILLIITVGGCYGGGESYGAYPASVSTYVAPRNSDPTAPSIKNDRYSPTIDVKTEGGERGAHPTGVELYGLYAKIDRSTGKVTAYVQWSDVYTDRAWRFYNRASNDKGQRYDFDKVDRSVSSCSYGTCVYAETYNIQIPQVDIRAGARNGVNFKIFSQTGQERVIQLSAELLREFVGKLDEAQKVRGSRT